MIFALSYIRMKTLIKICSYIWPITTKRSTQYNGLVEVTWYKGKQMLDSHQTNYSFGNLHKVMEFAIQKVFSNQQNILLLGLGAGSVPHILSQSYDYNGRLTAVEIDPEIIRIARQNFNIDQYDFLNIVEADAFDFINETTHKYDLIIVDLFIDNLVPHRAYENAFLMQLHNNLLPKGQIIINAGLDKKQDFYESKFQKLEAYFDIKYFEKIAKHNQLVILSMK